MKLPLSWLREWVDIDEGVQQLSARLTMLGFEIEAVEPVAPPFTNVVVAEITAIASHPMAGERIGNTQRIIASTPGATAAVRTGQTDLSAFNDLKRRLAALPPAPKEVKQP